MPILPQSSTSKERWSEAPPSGTSKKPETGGMLTLPDSWKGASLLERGALAGASSAKGEDARPDWREMAALSSSAGMIFCLSFMDVLFCWFPRPGGNRSGRSGGKVSKAINPAIGPWPRKPPASLRRRPRSRPARARAGGPPPPCRRAGWARRPFWKRSR